MAKAGDHRRQLETLAVALGTQAAVARLLGTESSRISEWRSGVKPRLTTLRRIADAAAAIEVLSERASGDRDSLRLLLETPMPVLGGSRPSELIRHDHGAEIVAVFAGTRRAADRDVAERDLVDALVALAVAARASARALEASLEA